MKSVVSAHTTKNDRLAEEERMFDILFGNILGNGTNNENTAANANDSNDDDVDRTITSTGNDTWVTINSNGTDATPVTAAASTSPSVVSPLDKSIVSPPLLSTSVDESLANDLASAMAYALNMPTAREITEVLQDMYILPDYRMHSDEEPCSDADDYSTSSSEYEYARRQRMPFAKKNGNAVVLGRRRRSQFRSSRTKKSTRTTDKNTANRVQSKNKSKGKEVSASKKKVRGPSLSKKNNEDKIIGLRILLRKKATQKDKNTKGGVPKTKTVRKMLKQKTPMNHGSVSDEGNAANFGFVIPGLACVTSSSPSTSIDASDTNDLGPDIDDFITSYGLTVEKTIADIKSAVDTVKFSDANDMAYAILGRPTPPEVSPSSINKNAKRASSRTTTSKSKKRGAAISSKKKKSVKIELLGSSRTPSPPTEDGTCNGSEKKFVTWSQKKLKASSLFKSIPTARSKHGIGPQRTLFKFKIGRRHDNLSGPDDFGIAAGPRSFLRLGQRSNDPRRCDQLGSDPDTTTGKHRAQGMSSKDSDENAEMSAETNIDSDDEMINHRARITVSKPSSAVPFDPDNNLLNISTDTPIEINCEKRLSNASGVSTKDGINDEEGTDGAANVQAKPSIDGVGSKWTKPRALFQSSFFKISKASSSLIGGSTTGANSNATEVPAQMDEELLVKIAELADDLYDDALTPSMSILRATKIIERHPENIEEIVAFLERRVKEKHSASADMTETAATPKKMPNSLDLTSLTDATEALSSPDISPLSKGGGIVSGTGMFGDVVQGIEKYGQALESLLGAIDGAAEDGEQFRRGSEGSSSFHDATSSADGNCTDDASPLASARPSKPFGDLGPTDTPKGENEFTRTKSQGGKKMGAVVTTFGIMAAGLVTATVALPKKKNFGKRRMGRENWQPLVDDEGDEEEISIEGLLTQNTNTFDFGGDPAGPEEACSFENIEVRATFVAESDDKADEENVEGIHLNVEESAVDADPLIGKYGAVVGMPEENGVEWNLSTVELDEPKEPEDHIDVEMNISLSSNGVEIYFDIDTDEIKSNLKNEQFLRELSAKLELYMRLEALYGKAETEEHAQCRLQAVLERFQGREQIVLLALRRQMEILALEEELQVDNHNERRRSLVGVHSQPCFGGNTNASMCEARNDDLVAEQSKSPVTKTNSNEEPIQEEVRTCSSNMKSSKVGIDELSADDDLCDADISADLDNLLRGTVEI